jgi:hypothetical protein
MDLLKSIKKLRLIALLLFVLPAIAIVGSLIFHNYIVSFNYFKNLDFNFSKNIPGERIEILCTSENDYCLNLELDRINNLDECYANKIDINYLDERGRNYGPIGSVDESEWLTQIMNYSDGRKLFFRAEITNKLDKNCILNSKSLLFYKIFPLFFEKIYNLKYEQKIILGTTETVNPFIYGETSISNIAKRFPINLIFKSFLYFGAAFMIFYWIYYNKIFNILNNKKKFNFFFLFGILSAIFLLLHVIFLGWKFESDVLTKLRRTYVVFFIFFELLAQSFLIRKLFIIKNSIKNYVNYRFIYLKLYFVLAICFSTFIIIFFLIFYDLTSKIDYILEWNYFVVLLIFYLLSFLMWKKIN